MKTDMKKFTFTARENYMSKIYTILTPQDKIEGNDGTKGVSLFRTLNPALATIKAGETYEFMCSAEEQKELLERIKTGETSALLHVHMPIGEDHLGIDVFDMSLYAELAGVLYFSQEETGYNQLRLVV